MSMFNPVGSLDSVIPPLHAPVFAGNVNRHNVVVVSKVFHRVNGDNARGFNFVEFFRLGYVSLSFFLFSFIFCQQCENFSMRIMIFFFFLPFVKILSNHGTILDRIRKETILKIFQMRWRAKKWHLTLYNFSNENIYFFLFATSVRIIAKVLRKLHLNERYEVGVISNTLHRLPGG